MQSIAWTYSESKYIFLCNLFGFHPPIKFRNEQKSIKIIYLLWQTYEFPAKGVRPQILVFWPIFSSTDGKSGQKFTWTQRIAAGIGVARGIQFLHTGIVPGVYSNRLKITDILLDHDLHVKINKYNLPLFTENRRLVSEEVFLTWEGSHILFHHVTEHRISMF